MRFSSSVVVQLWTANVADACCWGLRARDRRVRGCVCGSERVPVCGSLDCPPPHRAGRGRRTHPFMSSVDSKPSVCAVTEPSSPRAVLSSCASAGDEVAAIIITVAAKIAPIKPTTRTGAHNWRAVRLLQSRRGTSAVLLASELDSNAALLASALASRGSELGTRGSAPGGRLLDADAADGGLRRLLVDADASHREPRNIPARWGSGARERDVNLARAGMLRHPFADADGIPTPKRRGARARRAQRGHAASHLTPPRSCTGNQMVNHDRFVLFFLHIGDITRACQPPSRHKMSTEAPCDEAALEDIVAAIGELGAPARRARGADARARGQAAGAARARERPARRALAALTWSEDFSRVRATMLKLPEYKAKVQRARARMFAVNAAVRKLQLRAARLRRAAPAPAGGARRSASSARSRTACATRAA